MTTRHLIDPEVLPLVDILPTRAITADSLAAVRADSDRRYRLLGTPALAPRVHEIDGPGGVLKLFRYDPEPDATGRPALYHIHGGGMILGSAEAMQAGPAGLAAALNIPVLSVEYRLAPEHPFPAPQEDCLAGLTWLAQEGGTLGIDPARIGIIGESAGGGLAAATAQMARDLDGPALAAQILVYPMLDHRTGGQQCPYANPVTGEFVWNRASNQYGWSALRGDYPVNDARQGWYSPSLAQTLEQLPPAWIGTGSLDLFLDENLDYARRLIAAGVAAEMHVYPGGIHGFNVVQEARIAKNFSRDMLGAIAQLLGIGTRTAG